MKPLQNYIEEEIKKFNNNFESLVPYKVGFLDRNTEISCSHDISDYKRNAKKVLRELFSQSLHRIAKIEREKIIELIKSNTEGSFKDDGGNDCWYIDTLIEEIKKLK